ALVTIMQFRENLADRQAAEAVRARIDWKYLLRLALTDPGFDFSVLSEFRDRLLAGSAEELLLEKMLERCRALGLLTARGQQRTDSTHVLAAIRVLNRLELVAETLRAALNAVATVAPAWLQALTPLARGRTSAAGPCHAQSRHTTAHTRPRRSTPANATRSGPPPCCTSAKHASPAPASGARTRPHRPQPCMTHGPRSPSSRRSSK